MPESISIEDLGRPVYIRRKFYFDILEQIAKERGLSFEEVAVVGDICELDLLLPKQLGMYVMLIYGKDTPEYERMFIGSYVKGYTASNLQIATDRLCAIGFSFAQKQEVA